MKINRRDLVQHAVLGAGTAFLGGASAASPQNSPEDDSGAAEDLTHYVAGFVAGTNYQDIPAEVIELGKKSILDGIGLAFSGSVSHVSELAHKNIDSLGLASRGSTVIGTPKKVSPRFAAFLNGLSMHADD